VLGETLKTKWKSLRNNYQKHLRANKTTTSQAADATKGKHLEFLKPHLSIAKYAFL